ncbi:MAG: PP2C family protein-serine/threonine phosphatase, partial [Thermoanaerobaculia bacterium]
IGVPVGLFPGTTFQEATLELQPGDRFYLFSDGVVEAEAPTGETFDIERLTHCLANSRSLPLDDSLDRVLQDVERWCGTEGPGDDVSLVAVELPTDGKSTT